MENRVGRAEVLSKPRTTGPLVLVLWLLGCMYIRLSYPRALKGLTVKKWKLELIST